MGVIDRSLEGVWSGYVLKFGDPVPEFPGLVFLRSTAYESAKLYTQGPVKLSTGEHPVGQIAHIRKDAVGLHVVMPLDEEELPLPLQPFADRLIWTYYVDRSRIMTSYEEKDPMSGSRAEVLAVYPLQTIMFSIGDMPSGVQTSHVVVERRPKSGKPRTK